MVGPEGRPGCLLAYLLHVLYDKVCQTVTFLGFVHSPLRAIPRYV